MGWQPNKTPTALWPDCSPQYSLTSAMAVQLKFAFKFVMWTQVKFVSLLSRYFTVCWKIPEGLATGSPFYICLMSEFIQTVFPFSNNEA